MNSLLKMGLFMSLFILTLGFSQCRTAKDTLKIAQTIELSEVPITKAYYQKWIAGVRGGGSGVDLHIEKSVVMNKELITAYFRGKSVKFDPLTQNSTVYIARFKGEANQLYDINMEADAINEYGNKAPIKKDSIPFNLGKNDAVVSYLESNTLKFVKLINIPEKEKLAYPSAPRE